MKRALSLLLCGVLWVGLATATHAAKPPDYGEGGGPGCGLGSFLLKEKEGKIAHVLAALINSFFLINTMAVTSGTLGCETDGLVQRQHQRTLYAANNLPQLLHDMARADGEYLAAFADLTGVRPERQADFFRFSQHHLATIAPPTTAQLGPFLARFDDALMAAVTVAP